MTNYSEKAFWIWLSGIPGIGARRFAMINTFFGCPKALWESTDKDIYRLKSELGEKTINAIIDCKDNKYLDKALSILEMPNVAIITLVDRDYPELLKSIYDPPSVLYCKGLPLHNNASFISIIGSRRTTEYGRQMAERFAYEIASAGIGIVSGAARGIDTVAHKGALKAKGYTVAVLGCGVDIVYPAENKKLFGQIEEFGTIVSEYPPGTYPAQPNFPARNRIVSGISKALLVIEAGDKSGALITVDFALEQGRDVYALPGNITNPLCAGTNKLLKEGARLITNPAEILEDFNIQNGTLRLDILKEEKVQLDSLENKVYQALSHDEHTIEELYLNTGIHIGRLNAILAILEIRGIIKQLPGNKFVRRHIND